MDIKTSQEKKYYELVPKVKGVKIQSSPFTDGRIIIGRVDSCDIVLSHLTISAVHAVLEINGKVAKIYDMNSTNGTFVNGEKVITKEVHFGDTIKIADVELILQYYINTPELPPVLDSLETEKGIAAVIPNLPANMPSTTFTADDAQKVLPVAPQLKKSEDKIPYIVYPLAADPKAEFSEYIFEDVDNLEPIFKYEIGKSSVEVIILFNDTVYSVDYLPNKKATYHLVGADAKNNDVELAYLGKTDKIPFIEILNDEVTVQALSDYEVFHLSDDKKKESSPGTLFLGINDLIRLSKGNIEIYVRRVSAPPKVATAPFFKKDKQFRKYILLMFLLILFPLVGLYNFQVNEELEKEKAPERIATILYKKELVVSKTKAVEKTKEAPKVIQKAPKKAEPKEPKKVEVKKPQEKPKEKVVEKQNIDPKPQGQKTAKKVEQLKKGVQNPQKQSPTPVSMKRIAPTPGPVTKTTSSASASSFKSATQGHVDTYKSADFKSTVSSLVSKGGAFKSATATGTSGTTGITGANVGGGAAGDLRKADIAGNVGSLAGATTGKLESKGAEGLSSRRTIYTAGIPSETVILGSMDPDIIRRILREHIPQFRYCYQQELESNTSIAGTIVLNFIIGASGHVTRAGVSGERLPTNVKRCVADVLRGIQFPSPKGGGQVEVQQPMNFQPKKLE